MDYPREVLSLWLKNLREFLILIRLIFDAFLFVSAVRFRGSTTLILNLVWWLV
jgi:hypothetical protein